MKCLVLLGLLLAIGACAGQALADETKPLGKPTDEDLYGDLVEENDDKTGVQNDDVYGDYEEGPDEPPAEHNDRNNEVQEAKILSKPQTVVASIGQVITLPCQVSNKEPVTVWKHNNAILYQSYVAFTHPPNIRCDENGSLIITIENTSDFGEYQCILMLSSNNHPELVHTIVESPAPSIVSLAAENDKTVLSAGETLILTCRATGVPTPTISWHKGERLGTTGDTLTIENVTPENAGTYRCLADNKMGKPAHSIIDIFVKHAPIVSVQKYIVNSKHESDVELKCTVNAYPAPIVNWQKDGENVAENLPKIKLAKHIKNNHMETILTIKDLTEADFGVYTCNAVNALGKDFKNVTLVKTPAIRELQKPKDAKDLVLSWRVESKSPVSGHELQYRKKGDSSWKTVKPMDVSPSVNDTYVIKHTLKDLEDGQYETRARSQNEHGWSDYSEVMKFEKAKHGHHKHHTKKEHKKEDNKDHQTPALQQPSDTNNRSPAQGASTTGSGTSLTSSIFVVLSVSILRLIYTSKQS